MTGVGDIAKAKLETEHGISAEGYVCSCPELVKEMNELGPDGCRERLDELARKMKQSAIQWSKGQVGLMRVVRFTPLRRIKRFIEECCDEATPVEP